MDWVPESTSAFTKNLGKFFIITEDLECNSQEMQMLTLFEVPKSSGLKVRIKNPNKKEIISELTTKDGLMIGIGGKKLNELQYEIMKVSQKVAESVGRKIILNFKKIALKRRQIIESDVCQDE